MLSLWNKLGELGNDFQDWIVKNGDSPYFWLIIFFIGLVIGTYAIGALNKEK